MMQGEWKPATPCEMVCPDCRRVLPRKTIRHRCTDRAGRPLDTNYLEVYDEHGRSVSRTIAQNPLEMWRRLELERQGRRPG